MGRTISIALMAAALSLAHVAAHAAGLGRLTVLSALGQPLAAEIEIVALQAGEEDGLTARIAPAAAFRDAGIEVNPVLNSVRFSIQRRQGRPLLRVTTTQAVNEPFLELLVELQWSTGKLLREYTFLLDPPEYKAPPAIAAAPAAPAAPQAKPAPVPVPEVKPAPAPAPAVEPKPSATPEPVASAAPPAAPATESKPAPEPEKPVAEAAETKPAPAVEAKPLEPQAASARGEDGPPGATSTPQGAPETSQYEVKRGDTLGRIAEEHLPPGVTLNQMLIAIYRANPDAFIRENVNLVRAGHILNLPPADAAGGIDASEARRLVRAHRSDFEEYRSRLAAIAPRTDAVPGAQADAGRIEAKPEAPAAPQSSDQVRLSKADQQKPASAATRAAGADDAAARERALKEAQSRVTDLEKNVSDLQKLLELKNQQLAEMERKAAAKAAPTPPAAAAPAPPAAKAPEPVKPAAEAPKPMAQAPATPPPATPPPATPPPAPQAPVAQPSVPKPAVQPPAAKPKPKAAPPAQPTLLDEVLDHPFLIPGIAVVLILLVAYAAFAWRRKKATQARFQDSVLGAASGAGAASVFGGTPAGAATTGTGVSQTSVQPSGMSAEEVDPIAEADVYMAYGRDTQAEEILKEALAKDSKRVAVHAKLLEIYANRKDTQAFEKTALQLKALTGGRGPEWDKAVALGRSIDPQNGVYGGAAGPDATSPGFSAASAGAAAGAAAAAPALDFDLGGSSSQEQLPDISLDEPSRDAAPSSMDFDLGTAAPAPAEEPKADFTPEGTLIMGSQEPEKTHAGLDFDLGTSAAPSPAAPAAEKQPDISGLDFDLNIDLGGTGEAKPPDEKSAPPPDLSAISLDLGGPAEVSGGGGSDPKWQEVATKLDLAKAYDEMGDKDGARELLNEVMKDGDAAQKGQAEQLLAKLA